MTAILGRADEMRAYIPGLSADAAANGDPAACAWVSEGVRREGMLGRVTVCTKHLDVILVGCLIAMGAVGQNVVSLQIVGGSASLAVTNRLHTITDCDSGRMGSFSYSTFPAVVLWAAPGRTPASAKSRAEAQKTASPLSAFKRRSAELTNGPDHHPLAFRSNRISALPRTADRLSPNMGRESLELATANWTRKRLQPRNSHG